MKVHKGDMVQVISGPDKGAQGKVIEAYPKTNKVLVEGVNRIKKHVANSAPERGAEPGGLGTQEAPITGSILTVTQLALATALTRTARKSALLVATGRIFKA